MFPLLYHLHTHTHTHPFSGPFSGTTRVSWYQKGKTNLDFTEAREITMPAPHNSSFLQAGCPSCCPTNSIKSLNFVELKWHWSVQREVTVRKAWWVGATERHRQKPGNRTSKSHQQSLSNLCLFFLVSVCFCAIICLWLFLFFELISYTSHLHLCFQCIDAVWRY